MGEKKNLCDVQIVNLVIRICLLFVLLDIKRIFSKVDFEGLEKN